MDKEFVPYELALELKELGFDEDCFARYEGKIKNVTKPIVYEFTFANLPRVENKVGYPNYPYKDVEAPTFSQAFRWFREKYDLYPEIKKNYDGFSFLYYETNELNKDYWLNYILEMTDVEKRKKKLHRRRNKIPS